MRGIRLIVLLLVLVMSVVGLLVSAGPAAAEDGRQFVETSGPFSGLCQFNLDGFRSYPRDRDPWWNAQVWWSGPSWSRQDGQLYLFWLDGHAIYHWGRPHDPMTVAHSLHEWWIAPVSSYSFDLTKITGWYEGRYEESTVAEGWGTTPLPLEGHLTGQGMGTFAGQTIHITTVVTDYGGTSGVCPPGEWPVLNGTMTMRFTGKP